MSIVIQKHHLHPIWKFYDENKLFLGQILGTDKESMLALSKVLLPFLSNEEVSGFRKEILSDGSMNIYELVTNKRVAGFEKDFSLIAQAIENNN
jgi:vacuolar-type H+-ATPase catalytic subunit A/Vma1